MPCSNRLVARLTELVGPAHVLVDPGATRGYCVDWTGRFQGATPAVVRPGSTSEVAAVIGVCRDMSVAVVAQGGNTGLVGGGVPLTGEVVISLRRLSDVTAVNRDAGQLTAGAGATIGAVHAAAASVGWAYGVDFASRHSATVGGSIATNAGGPRVLRYGDTRAQLVGVEAVLGDASVISRLSGLVKDNTGYDLASLLCGSEGTLGIVTAARLRLVPVFGARVTALLAFPGVADAIEAGAHLRRHVGSLEAIEVFLDNGLTLVCGALDLARPFPRSHGAYLLVEAADRESPFDELSSAVASLDSLGDAAVAVDSVRRAQLWRYRDGLAEAINTMGPPHKLDVSLPGERLAEFVSLVQGVVSEAVLGAASVSAPPDTWLFGHLGDGNIHVNVTGVAPDDERVDEAVLRLAAALGGSISAEHGIGAAKRRWLGLSRSAAEIAAFRTIKGALDAANILNPNVLLPPAGQ